MEQIPQALIDWAASIQKYEPVEWERLPELDLYMDQVITLMDKHLAPFCGDGERLLTSSMINNYVKDGVLPRPESKKYSRKHLAMLLMICMLKSVLTLPETHAILEGMSVDNGTETLYPAFSSIHQQAVREVAQRLGDARNQDTAALYQLAMTMALEANARRIAAARILDSLAPQEDKDKEKEKEKEKDREKKEDKKSKKERSAE